MSEPETDPVMLCELHRVTFPDNSITSVEEVIFLKLILKRDNALPEGGFTVFDETGFEKYRGVIRTEPSRQRIVVGRETRLVSDIVRRDMFMRFFTVRCRGRLFVLFPSLGDCFAFRMFGTNYRFAGNISSGRFSLYDVDKSPVMTMKKCWGRFGSGYELNIFREKEETFALSVAICAASYLTAETETPSAAAQ